MALSRKDIRGLQIMAAMVTAVAALFFVGHQLSSKAKVDGRGCPAVLARSTAVVIDRSDDTPFQTVEEITARVRRIVAEGTQEGELVSLFEISGASRTALRPVFSACVPPRDGSDIYENRAKIQRRFAERFEQPLDRALAAAPMRSESSPISEAIIDLSASQYLSAPANRLIVFSDLMQNSANASLYGCRSAKTAIDQFRGARAGAIERPTFRNTVVELNVIPREGLGRNTVACRDGFWAWFFGDGQGEGASLNSSMLPGGARIQ